MPIVSCVSLLPEFHAVSVSVESSVPVVLPVNALNDWQFTLFDERVLTVPDVIFAVVADNDVTAPVVMFAVVLVSVPIEPDVIVAMVDVNAPVLAVVIAAKVADMFCDDNKFEMMEPVEVKFVLLSVGIVAVVAKNVSELSVLAVQLVAEPVVNVAEFALMPVDWMLPLTCSLDDALCVIGRPIETLPVLGHKLHVGLRRISE